MAEQPIQDPLAAQERQRTNILRFVRLGFLVLITTVALLLTIQTQESRSAAGGKSLPLEWWVPVSFAVVMFVLAYLIDLFTPNKKISTIAGVFLGLLAGMLCTAALGVVIDLLMASYVQNPRMYEAIQPLINMLKVMLGITLCYLGVSAVLQTQDDFRLVIPYVEFSKQLRGVRPNVLDTSALIDARIADVAACGLIQSPLVIPKFVIAELQILADSSDKLKRARGRRGLDIVTRLQRQGTIDVAIDDTRVSALAVDQMLVEVAKKLSARLITTDLGLTRVAQIHGVTVLNLHDIANVFKPAMVPGEQITLRIVKPGEQAGQGVGYLDDGTMVVAEGGAQHIGDTVALIVTSALQTTAGRLIFARTLERDAAAEALGNSLDQSRAPVPDREPPREHAHAAPEPTDNAPSHATSTPIPALSPDGPEPAAPPRQGPLGPRMFGHRGGGTGGSPRNPRR